MRLRSSTLALLAALVVAAPAQAQIADTVRFTVQGVLTTVSINLPQGVLPGDSVVFTANALDADGDPVNVVQTWGVRTIGCGQATCTDAVTVDPSTGHGFVVRKTLPGEEVELTVLSEQFDALVLGSFRLLDGPSAITFSGFQNAFIGDEVQYCAYLLWRGQTVAYNLGQPYAQCPPGAFPPAELDRQVDSAFGAGFRVKPYDLIMHVASAAGLAGARAHTRTG